MKKILFVDDEIDVLDVFSELLSPHFKMCCCESVEKARELIKNFDYDLLLSDYNLGIENGVTLCEEFKESTNKPTILFTGFVEMFGRKIDKVDVILEKPCSFEILRRTIKERLEMV